MRHAIHNCLRAKDIEQSQNYAVQRFAAPATVEQDRAHGCGIDKRGGCRQACIKHFDRRIDGCAVAGARTFGDYKAKLGRRKIGGPIR